MTTRYKINEIFWSYQGEGWHTGKEAIFVRFAGCNLKCDFCDTEHDSFQEMTAKEIASEIKKCAKGHFKSEEKIRIILTGGEPTLQLDYDLVSLLYGFTNRIHIETNGTKSVDKMDYYHFVNWRTVSPKKGSRIKIEHCDELKFVVSRGSTDIVWMLGLIAKIKPLFVCLQPESGKKDNILHALELCNEIPCAQLSLQLHKIMGIR